MAGNASYQLTEILENLLLDESMGVGSKLFPSGVYLALHGPTPGDESTFASELASSIASQYARVRLHMRAASGGVTKNATDALYATAGGPWPTVGGISISNVATERSGSMLWWGAPNAVMVALVNQRARFPADAIDVSLD